MMKKIISLALVVLLAFACVVPAFAMNVRGDTVAEAATGAATWAFMLKYSENGEEPTNYEGFKVTRSIKQTDDEGETYYDVVARSGYAYKYSCKVYGYKVTVGGLPVVSSYTTDTAQGTLEETNVLMGMLGTLIDQVFTIFLDLVSNLVAVE